MNLDHIGMNLQRIMKALRMNQTELAKRTGLTQAAISQIVNNERAPSLPTIIKILEVIPIKFEDLVE